MNQHKQNHCLKCTEASATGGLNKFHWYNIFALYSVVSTTGKNCSACMEASYLLQCINTEQQSNQISTLR